MPMLHNMAAISLITVITFGISGCSYKNYRNKPSIFLPAQNISDVNISNDVNASFKPYCMEINESIMTGMTKTEYGHCDGYYTVDASKIIGIDKRDQNKSNIINGLLLLSDENCRRFVDKFYYNDFMGKSGFQLLKLNVFGNIGINIGGVQDFTTSELMKMHDTLNANLQYRSKLKSEIMDKANDTNTSMPVLLNKIRIYDHACSLLINEQNLSGAISKDK